MLIFDIDLSKPNFNHMYHYRKLKLMYSSSDLSLLQHFETAAMDTTTFLQTLGKKVLRG